MSRIVGYVDEDVLLLAQDLEHYFDDDYDEQTGGITDVFLEYGQEGRGWGSTALKGLWSFFRPALSGLAKAALGSVAQQGIEAATGYIGDLYKGRNWREAGRERAEAAAQALGSKLRDSMDRMAGSGQYGGNKTLHHGVKLFSFSPTAGRRGCAPAVRKRRRRRVVKKTVGTRRKVVRRKKRRTTGGTRRKRAPARRRRRANPRGQQGSGFWL